MKDKILIEDINIGDRLRWSDDIFEVIEIKPRVRAVYINGDQSSYIIRQYNLDTIDEYIPGSPQVQQISEKYKI